MKSARCPYCFESLPAAEVSFRCINPDATQCPPVEDEVLGRHRRVSPAPSLPRVFTATGAPGVRREAECTCGAVSVKVVCSSCHNELPGDLGATDNYTIALIGAKESGKSNYVAVLIEELMRRLTTAFGASMNPLDDGTGRRFQNDFRQYLYVKREVVPVTRSARVEAREPLVYRVSFEQRQYGILKRLRVLSLVFFDTAGEDLTSLDLMSTEAKYIATCDGLIFLLDPLQIPAVRDRFRSGVHLPGQNTDPQEILGRVADLLRRVRRLPPNARIPTPVALAFSKIDAMRPLVDPTSAIHNASHHDGFFDVADAERMHEDMRAHLAEWTGVGLEQFLRHNFDAFFFFGVSALGSAPEPDGRLPAGVAPFRVDDPFLWLLYKLGIIHRVPQRTRERRARILVGLVSVAALLLVALASVTVWYHLAYRRDPRALPENLAIRACRDPSPLLSDRCQCLTILAAAEQGGTTESRLEVLGRYRDGCVNDPRTAAEPPTAGLILAIDLLRAMSEPDGFCQPRIAAAVRAAGTAGKPQGAKWYPATTSGETAFMKWAAAVAVGDPAPPLDELRSALSPEDLHNYPQLRQELDAAAEVAPCLGAWKQARSDGKWKPVATACGAARKKLPPAFQARLASDMPPATASWLDATEPAEEPAADPSCGAVKGFSAQLYPAPPPDGLTYANLAVTAVTRPAAERYARLAAGLDLAHDRWLALLSPWTSSSERFELAGRLTDPEISNMVAFLEKPWIRLEKGTAFGDARKARSDGRVPWLSLRSARDTACALVGVTDSFAQPGAAAPWNEPVVLEPLDPAMPLLVRARLAVSLLRMDPMPKSPYGSLCQVTSLLALSRAAQGPARARLVSELIAALKPLKEHPTLAASAFDLHCHVAAETDRPEELDQQLSWLMSSALVQSANAQRAGACALRAVLSFIGQRKDSEAVALVNRMQTVLAEEDTALLRSLLEARSEGAEGNEETIKAAREKLAERFSADYLRTALSAVERTLE